MNRHLVLRSLCGRLSALHLLLAAAFLLLSSLITQAQTADTLRGQVRDANGAALPSATVMLTNLATGLERIAITNANGAFRFNAVWRANSAERYQLTAQATGFAVVVKLLEANSANEIEFKLAPAGVTENITIVSGSRQEELRESLDTKVAVVSRTRIRDTGYETVAEVLQEVPGVVTRRGTPGAGAAGAQVQGIDSRQVLVLFDGQPLIGARGIKRGVLNLDRQSVNNLERIEVVKGASSALYGSNAIGGVINQITREPAAPLELAATASGGSQGRTDYRGDVGLARERFSAFFSAEQHKQNPFDLTPTTFDTTGAGYNRTDALARFKYKFTPQFARSAWARSYWTNEVGRSRGEESNQTSSLDEDSQTFNLQGDWQLDQRTSLQARGYFARFDEISNNVLVPNTRPLAPGNLFERYGKFDASLTRILGARQLLQAGGEWVTDRYRGFNRLADDKGKSAATTSLWAQDKISLKRATVTLGLRFDHHSIFGNAVSPKAGLNFRLTENWRARAAYGRGFRAPDLGQLFYRFLNPTNLYQVIGNPNLKPEYAHSVQVGSEFSLPNRCARFGVNLFYNDVQDLIDSISLGFVATPQQLNEIAAREGIDLTPFRPALGRLLFLYKNIAEAVTQGVEFDGDVNLSRRFIVSGAYTYLNARDNQARQSLLNRHKHQGHVRFAWESNQRLGLRANVRGTFFSKWINTRWGGRSALGCASIGRASANSRAPITGNRIVN